MKNLFQTILSSLIISLIIGSGVFAIIITPEELKGLTGKEEMFSAFRVLHPNQGGTGTGEVPDYGDVLIGNADGTYDPMATSSLSISPYNGEFKAGWFTATSTKATSTFPNVDITQLGLGFTKGSIPFSNGSHLAQDNSNLFWDDANNRLGIGNAVPATLLDVDGVARANEFQLLDNEKLVLSTDGNASIDFDSVGSTMEFAITGSKHFKFSSDTAVVGLFTIDGNNPQVIMADPFNVSNWSFGSSGGAFQIIGDSVHYMRFGGDGGVFFLTFNRFFNNIDVIFNDDVSQLARFDAGAEALIFADDKKIIHGTGLDVSNSYNSGTNDFDINVAGGVNTGVRIISDGGLLTLDGSNGDWLLAGADKFQFGDSGTYINQGIDGHIDVNADVSIDLNAPVLVNSAYTLPTADGSANDIIKTDGAGTLAFVTPTVDVPIALSMTDPEPSRASETNWNGGLLSLATAQPLNSSPTNIVVTKGTGKILVSVNAGSDISGTITITGTSVDRDTMATTPADTDTIIVDALTTDGTDTDGNGNTRHAFTGVYITSKWFTGTVTLSTADLTLTDVDVYHISFEQFNDSPGITLNTFDANLFTTNVNAEFDAYLYDLHTTTGDKCDIERHASLNVGTDGETAITNKYWRLRTGNINEPLDGTTDGIWVDVHYPNSPAYVEDVTIKVWATKSQPLTFN